MDKSFGVLLAAFLLTILGSLAVMALFCAINFIKETIADWRE